MLNIKLTKVSDEGNALGYKTIRILDKSIAKTEPCSDVSGKIFYFYEFLCLFDEKILGHITEDDMDTVYSCYEVV